MAASKRLIIPVILSGGSGTRLWPMSTPERPKQFLALTGQETMFQSTLARCSDATLFSEPMIVANQRHASLIQAQLLGRPARLMLEPCARNTAPAIALAAFEAGDSVMLVMPSDHVIEDVPAFHAAIRAALPLVEEGWLVTFGIAPDAPETGYGYIKVGDAVGQGVHKVERFVEKPDAARAAAMLEEGGYAWNGGIFLFSASTYLEALLHCAPEIHAHAHRSWQQAVREDGLILPEAEAFAAAPSESIDYAVMEKADRVATVPVAMGWSDLGSWDALYGIADADEDGNSASGPVRLIECSGNLVRSDGLKISMAGIDDLIIIAQGNDIMILPRGQSQKVKAFSS